MLTLKQIKQFYPEDEKISERNMLREYLQYKILEVIFSSKYAHKLNFIGGTAIRIIYGSDRFSEDLDFDHFSLGKAEFGDMAASVKKSLEKENFHVETKFVFKEAYRCHLKFKNILFEYHLSEHQEEKFVIQLDTTKQSFDIVPDSKIINKFGIFANVRVNPSNILLAQKIAAVLGRKRLMGRDLYDIVFLASLTEPRFSYIQEKLEIEDAKALKARIQERLARYKLSNLAKDILPFVSEEGRLEVVKKFDRWLADWDFALWPPPA